MTTLFRVHFAGSIAGPIDVTADTPEAARKAACEKFPGAIVSKVKVVKERADA